MYVCVCVNVARMCVRVSMCVRIQIESERQKSTLNNTELKRIHDRFQYLFVDSHQGL